MTCSTTGGGVRATFLNSEGAKINDSLGPPGVQPPGYAPVSVNEYCLNQQYQLSTKDNKSGL